MEDNPIPLTTPTLPVVESNAPEDATLEARKEDVSKDPGRNINFNTPSPIDRTGSKYSAVSGYKIDKYLGKTPYFADLNNRDAQAARAQSAGAKLANGLYQGIVGEVIGGSLQGIGALGMAATSEENLLYQMGDAIREGASEDAFIFQREPGKAFAFNDAGWWASNIPSLLSTLSMFVPGLVVGKAASLAGQGISYAGRAGRIAKVRKTAANVKEADKIIKGMAGMEAKAAAQMEAATNTIATAVGMRHAENIREAVDVAKQAEDDFLQADLDINEMQGTEAYRQFVSATGRQPKSKYELAKYVGGAAAKNAYSVNSANIVFDLAQTAMIFKPFKAITRGAKATTAEAAEAAKKLGSKVVKESTGTKTTRFLDKLAPVKEFGLGMASEGAEEAVNFIGSAEGLSYAEELRGIKRGDFSERLEGYLADDHLWESAFWGALGGGVFQAVGGAFGKKQNALLRAYEERIKTQEYFATEIKKAEEANDPEKTEQLKSQMITSLALQAAQAGRVDSLLDQLNDDSYIEELAKTGLGTVEELVEKRAEIIQQVEQVEARYKEAVTWADKNGMDSFAKGAYLNDSLRAHSTIAHADSILSKLDEIDKLGNEEEILAAKIQLLEEIKGLSTKEERDLYKDIILEIMDEKAQYEKKNDRGVRIKPEDLNNDLRQRVTLEAMRRVSEKQISNMKSDNSRISYMEKGEAMRKAEFEKFKKRTIEEIAKEENEERLNDIVKTAKRTKEKELQEAAEKRLAELAEIKKAQDESVNPKEPDETDETEDQEEDQEEEDDDVPPEGTQGEFDFGDETPPAGPKPEDDVPPVKPDESEDIIEPRRPSREREDHGSLLQRLQQLKSEEERESVLQALRTDLKELEKERARIGRRLNKAKKINTISSVAKVAAYESQRNEVNREIKQLRKEIQDVEKLDLLPEHDFTGPQRKLDKDTLEEWQTKSDNDGGSPIFITELLKTFVSQMDTNAPQMFGLDFREWRLKGDLSQLELDSEKAEIYEALMAALNGTAEVSIELSKETFKSQPEEDVEIYVGGDLQNVTELEVTRKDKQAKLTVPANKYNNKDYAIVVNHNGKKVIVGYLPQVNTLAKHAVKKNIYAKTGDIGNQPFEIAYVHMHTNGYSAIHSLDRLIRLRRILAERGDAPVSIKLHQGRKNKRRGSLLRPGVNSKLTIGSLPRAEEAVDTYGFAYMGKTNDGTPVLRSMRDNGVLSGSAPYQDGKVFGQPEQMDYGMGQLYMPVFTSAEGKEVIWIRVPNISVNQAGTLEELAEILQNDPSDYSDLKEFENALKAFIPVKSFDKILTKEDIRKIGGTSNGVKNGAIIDKSGTVYIFQDGKSVGYFHKGEKNGKFDLGNLQSSMSASTEAAREAFEERIPQLLQTVKSPVAPIVDSNNNFLGYFHPVAALPQTSSKKNFPDTEDTAMRMEVDRNSIPDPIDVTEPATEKKLLKKEREAVLNQHKSFPEGEFVRGTGETKNVLKKYVRGYLQDVLTLDIKTASYDAMSKNLVLTLQPGDTELEVRVPMHGMILGGSVILDVDTEQVINAYFDALSKKDSPSNKGFKKPRGRRAFMTHERAQASALSERATSQDQAEADAWMNKNLPHVPYKRVKGLIKRGGITAYGVWEDGMVKVSDIGVIGVEYHEAFHAVMDMYLDPKRKAKILAEAEAKYGKLGPIELEEKLAEAFREYVLSDGKTMSEKTAISRFFAELAALVKAMFNGQYQTRKLMQQINKGKFAQKPDARTQNYVNKFMKSAPFDAMEMKELKEIMPAVLDETLNAVNAYIALKISDPKANVSQLKKDFFQDDQVGEELLNLIEKIGNNMLARRAEQSEETGNDEDSPSQLVSNKQIASDLIEAALINDEFGGIETLFATMADTATPEQQEKLLTDLNRIRDSREYLVKTLSEDKVLMNSLIGTLEADIVVGATDNEQYGKKSMAEVNPKEKIPSAVRNLIGRTMAFPTSLSMEILEYVEKKDSQGLLNAIREKGLNNTYDQFSRFGLPRVLNFNNVFPYLLHHLSSATTYNEMIDRMKELARKGNPDMLMLVAKLEDPSTPQLVKNQFFVAFKKQKTDELNIEEEKKTVIEAGRTFTSVTLRSREKGPVPPEAVLAKHNQELMKALYVNTSEEQRKKVIEDIDKLLKIDNYAAKDKKAVIAAIEATGFTTITPGALVTAVVRKNNTEIKTLLNQAKEAYKSLDPTNKGAQSAKQDFKILETLAKYIVASDYGAVSVGFNNGSHNRTLVYSHQLPNFLSEELDRLQDTTYRNTIINEDNLQGTSWSSRNHWSGSTYIRFGHYKGKPYTELNALEFLEYSYLAFRAESGSGYIPIPTPSDATNSALVKTRFNNLGEGNRTKFLQKIIDLTGGNTTVEEMRAKFKKEAQEILAKEPKFAEVVKARLARMEKNKGVEITQELIVEDVALLVEATFDSHWNTSHWIGAGIESFNKGVVDFQKRAKQILSPGSPSVLQDLNETFKSVTFVEPIKKIVGYKDDVQYADAQSYVTLAHYRKIMDANGKLTPAMDAAITKAENRQPLTVGERALLRPYKPFYYGRVNLGKKGRTPVQIKNSLFPLVPEFVDKHPQLKAMHEFMKTHKIDQMQPVSAQKVGAVQTPVKLWNSDGTFNVDAEFDYDTQAQELPMRNYRQQVQINDHMMASDTIGWGTQTSKIITGGLAKRGEKWKSINDALLKKEEKLMQTQVKKILGKFTVNGEINDARVRKYIKDNAGSNISTALQELLDSEKSLNNPIHKAAIATNILAALQKDFYKLQVPGGMQVQVSDLGIYNGVDEGLKGMRIEGGKVLPGQVITSRNFLPKKYRNMSIEQIKKEDPDALKLIVYRVPSEGKNSMAVVEVIDFMEPGQDGMIVPADFVVQMGSDFDVDKLHINWKTDKTDVPSQLWNEYFDLMEQVLTDPTIFTEEVQQPQGFKDFSDVANEVKKSTPERQLKDKSLSKDGTVDSYAQDNAYSLLTHLTFHQDNVAGISLKGIAAKANTFWLNVDRYGINLAFEETVGSISGLNSNLIDREKRKRTAQAVAASMDGAKDPVYGYLGINQTNFTFFHDLYMLGVPFKEAIAIASNRFVKADLAREDVPTDKPTPEDKKAKAYLAAYKKEWQFKLQTLKQVFRAPDLKLKDMANSINPIDDAFLNHNEAAIEVLKEVTHNQEVDSIFELPAIQGYLDMVRASRNILSHLGVEYYTSMRNTKDIEFFDYNRFQTLAASEAHLGSRNTKYVRMGMLETTGSERAVRKKGIEKDYINWNMQDFFSFFLTEEGKQILEKDNDLAKVVSHLALGSEYQTKFKGKSVSLINVLPVQLRDEEIAAEFAQAWENLYDADKHPIAKALSDALVDYEAERSGWRYGRDTFTAHLPSRIVNRVTSTSDASGNATRLAQALSPNIEVTNKKTYALLSTKTVLLVEQGPNPFEKPKEYVYVTQYDIDGKPIRTKIAAPPRNYRGLKPTLTIDQLKVEAQGNISIVQEDIKNLKNRKKYKSVESVGKEENFDTRKAELESKFAAAGVKVKVVKDDTIENAGDVEWDGKSGVIRVHPTRMGGDTLIHEFAHIYVEILGYNNPLVQQAIKELQGTELYAEIKAKYPELNKRDLDMEVLVTAMGRKGDQIFDQVQNQSKLRTLINKIIRAIGKVLGVQQDTAKLLAESMIRGEGMSLNANTEAFKAEQRLSKRLSEQQLQEELVLELNERIAEMRQLGMTSEEEQTIKESFIQTRTNLKNIDVQTQRDEFLSSLIGNIENTLGQSLAFINTSSKYLNDTARNAEMTQSDTEFFNTLRQLKQILSTYDQAVENFSETGPSNKLVEFKALKDRIPSLLRQLRDLEKQAISNKLKANSSNPDITEIELNLFDLAQHLELSSYMQDSNTLTSQLQGLGEQDAVVLQLLHKQINRVVEGFNMEAKNDKDTLNEILDTLEESGTPVENLLDKTKQAFISPIQDSYWKSRAMAIAQGMDSRMWEAYNNHMPYTEDYYSWKYKTESPEEKDLRQRLQNLEEIDKKRGLTEEEKMQRMQYQKDLEDIQIGNAKESFWTFHEADIDQAAYDADRAAAKKKGPEALKEFDLNNIAIVQTGAGKYNRRPQRNTKYFKGYVVKDKYKNPEWKEGDQIRPKDKYRNPDYDRLSDLEKETIEKLKALMGKRIPADSTFMMQGLIPQVGETPDKSLKEHLNEQLKVEGQKQQQRLDADGRMVPIPPRLAILQRNKPEQPVSTDLRKTISQLIDETAASHARETLATFMLATRDQLADADLVTPSKGLSITNFGKNRESKSVLTKGERSRAMEVLEHVLEGYLGAGWTDKTKNDKIVKKFLTYNSFMGIGINPSAWINNITYGGLQQRLETLGGAQWERSQMKEARKIVYRNIVDLVRARKKGFVPPSKDVALLTWFDVTMDQRELPDDADSLTRLWDTAYFGQTYGEIVMQSQVALAMMMNTKVILANGSETNLYEALTWDGKRGINLPEGALLVRADGQQVPLTLQEVGAQKSKYRSVLQRIHGAYNQEDLGMWHRKTVGQVFMQFRKWVPASVKRRFGKDSFSEIREEREVGYYRALFKEIVMGGLKKDGKYLQFLSTYKDQPPHIQKAALKGLYELMSGAFVAGASALLVSLVELDPDDDDEWMVFNDEFYKAKLLYHTDRLHLELTQYTPWGIYDFYKKLGKDPAAGYRTATNVFNILNEAAYSSIHWDLREYKGGRHYGEAKLPIYLSRLVPFWKQAARYRDTVDSVQAYSLS